MFKKPLSDFKTSAPLRGSDRRKLKQRVVQSYGVSPEVGDVLVPDGLMSQKIKTYTNDPGVVYFSPDGDPLWFSVGKDPEYLIPTVYTLWKKYDLLPYISTPASVIPILTGGADLMVPGVVQISSPSLTPPQLVAITEHTMHSPTTRGPPLAVGRLAIDLGTQQAGAKGKAVHVLHVWKDHLFSLGNKTELPGEVETEPAGETREDDERNAEAEAVRMRDQQSTLIEEIQGKDMNACDSPLRTEASMPDATHSCAAAEEQLSKEEVSDILRTAVLQAIHSTAKSLPPSSFPIPAGTFYSSYILPFRPASIHGFRYEAHDSVSAPTNDTGSSKYPPIDIKHSTHKSLAAFLKKLDKERLLTLKDMKPEPLVMSVSASHPDVTSYKPYASLRDMQIKEEKREKREEEERSRVKEIKVRELWKPHAASGSESFFDEGDFDCSALYTDADLVAVVNKYAAARQLVNVSDQSYVNVSTDELLLNTVAERGESLENLEFLKREEVVRRLSQKMQSWYEIQAEGREPLLKKGQLNPISVVVRSRYRKRVNTLVTGFEPFLLESEELAEELKRICAGATSVSPLLGKSAGLEVAVQGKHIKAVTDFLLSRGVPKRWIVSAGQIVKK